MARRTAPPKYIQKRTPKTFVFFHWNYHACSDIGVAFSHRFCIRGTQISSREPMVSRDARSPPLSLLEAPWALAALQSGPCPAPQAWSACWSSQYPPSPQQRPHPNDPSGVPRRCYDKNTFATGGSGGQVHHIFLLRNCTPKINEKPLLSWFGTLGRRKGLCTTLLSRLKNHVLTHRQISRLNIILNIISKTLPPPYPPTLILDSCLCVET
jgi:hypothetical protein